MHRPAPSLKVLINFWSLWNETNSDGGPWSLDQRVDAVAAAGFDAYTCPADAPGLAAALERNGLRFGAAFDAARVEQFAPLIRAGLEIDHGPMNCQLADHDTPVDEAIRLTIALMEEADRQGAEVHLEVHRDTCTETPEKTAAIIAGCRERTGVEPRVNFDFSHPAIIKHLEPGDFADRLFENVPLFQRSTLWHMRPFNGSHCQVPVTDGNGIFSQEYQDVRPFIAQAFRHWLAGSRPNHELWVVPEVGPKSGYGLSCFPESWPEAIALGNDLRTIWNEEIGGTKN